MNKLPKKLNRWMILAIVMILSVLLTYLVLSNNNKQSVSSKLPLPSNTPSIAVNNPPVQSNPVSVKLVNNLTSGYVDIFITNSNVIDNGELVFKLNGNTRFSKIEENTLFEKYFTSNETDKSSGVKTLKIGVTKGMEGASVSPGTSQKFARLYFSELQESSLILDVANSSFFVGVGNPIYKVVQEN